jgi:hypothetical protein
MDEFKSSEKNDNLKQLINNNADIISSGISGTLSLLLAGDPLLAALAGPAGTLIERMLKGIGKKFSQRQLSPREDFRVGKVLAIAALEINQRLENGENYRNDGFFDQKPTDRSDAEEIAESIMLKCQREPQEKKILYMGYLKAGIAFDSNVSADMGHQLIKVAEQLTYQQFCILKLVAEKNSFGLRSENYRSYNRFPRKLYPILYECKDLHDREYINFGDEVGFGLTNTIPENMTLQGIGRDLFNFMKLTSIPDEDIIPIAKVLK